MRIEAFEIDEPAPQLGETHAIVTLRPWVDVGRVGRNTLIRLERFMDAQEIGRLARPGNFYDFTRYRPRMMNVGVERRITIPNTTILFAKREQPPDFLFLHLLEPHAFGEDFIDSLLEVLKHFQVTRYIQVGGVSDAVPHTRPLLASGSVPDQERKRFGIQPSTYQGPTSITYLVIQEAPKLEIETMNFLVRLPHYAQLDEDYSGVARIMEILCEMYNFPSHLIDSERGQRQYEQLDAAMARNAQAKNLVQQLEASYDTNDKETSGEGSAPLSPEVERFLQEMDRRLDGEEE